MVGDNGGSWRNEAVPTHPHQIKFQRDTSPREEVLQNRPIHMAKYGRFNPLGLLRTLRWWFITYGSYKPFRHPLLFWLRTPPLSVITFAGGVYAGVWYVLNYVPCP